jgi:hypothetical protein
MKGTFDTLSRDLTRITETCGPIKHNPWRGGGNPLAAFWRYAEETLKPETFENIRTHQPFFDVAFSAFVTRAKHEAYSKNNPTIAENQQKAN